MEKKLFYMFMLLLVTFFWGVTFPIIKTALQYVSADAFLAFRFLIATALMGILVRKGGDFRKRRNILTGFTAGFLLFLGYYFQTVGLDYTSAAASGIITGIYVVRARNRSGLRRSSAQCHPSTVHDPAAISSTAHILIGNLH